VKLPIVIPSVAAIKYWENTPLGVTDWVPVTQERIDGFAEATGDRQWIHVDVERARIDSVWKQTIAHGYLTLAMIPALLSQLIEIVGVKTAVNTGIDKLRFSAPVPSGSRVRLKAQLGEVREVPASAVRITFAVRIEVEGGSKPALIASVNYLYFPV
jgi:acyl dehydratase